MGYVTMPVHVRALVLMAKSYFASGTGAAGLVGAFLWWELRNLGVQTGVGISAVRHVLGKGLVV